MILSYFRIKNEFIEVFMVFLKCFQVKRSWKWVFGIKTWTSIFQSPRVIKKLSSRQQVICHYRWPFAWLWKNRVCCPFFLKKLANMQPRPRYAWAFWWLASTLAWPHFFSFHNFFLLRYCLIHFSYCLNCLVKYFFK